MDRHRSGRALTALGLIALTVLLGAAPAGADATAPHLLDVHAREVAHQVPPVPLPPAASPSVALLAVGLVLLASRGWWRRATSRSRGRALAIALSLVLTVFTVETAVHSVHHLADHESGTDCPVLAGSQGLAWGAADLVGTVGPSLEVSTALPLRSDDGPRWQLCRPSAGRAPPA